MCVCVCVCQVLKATADVAGGRALYDGYSAVTDSGSHNFLRLRDTVLLRKEDRKMFVQANTRVQGTLPRPGAGRWTDTRGITA